MDGIWWLKPTVEILQEKDALKVSTTQVAKRFRGYSKTDFETQFAERQAAVADGIRKNLAAAGETIPSKSFELLVASLAILWMHDKNSSALGLVIQDYIAALRHEVVQLAVWVLCRQQRFGLKTAAGILGVNPERLAGAIKSEEDFSRSM